jgi:heptosyltransferase II
MKILLVQTSFLGDTILSTPVISGIHQAYPDAALFMMTTPQSAALVQRDPLLAGIITFDKRNAQAGISGLIKMAARLRSENFDQAYVLHRSYRTALLMKLAKVPVRIGFNDAKLKCLYTDRRPRNLANHDVLRNLSLIKKELPLKFQGPELRLFPPGKQEVSENIREALGSLKSPVVLVPGSVWATKRWAWEGFRETARHFIHCGHSVLIVGGPEDRALSEKIAMGIDVVNLTGESDIADVMFIIRQSRLVICNDSMTMHIACAFKIPVVAIFCATTPSLGYYPWKNKNILLEIADLKCKPCGRHGGNRCPTGTYDCIKMIKPEHVITAATRLLTKP